MKYILLAMALLTSLFLTSCQNNPNDENVPNTSGNSSQDTNNPNQNTERLSYDDYVQQYKNVDKSIDDSYKDNKSNYNNETTDDNKTIDINEIIPETTNNASKLASYSTPLKGSTKDRINNIEIVCKRLNGFILKPGKTFSYNDTVGPYGPSDGFKEATILLSDGTHTKGYGGGVCQLSSTLYNVVKNIENVEITERHHHSAPVSYVPKNQDATISLQSNLDFKFVNNNSYGIRFEATCLNGNVNVSAYKA